MKIEKHEFGVMPSGEKVYEYEMTNNNGMLVSIIELGGCINKIVLPTADGKGVDVNQGYTQLDAYLYESAMMGATVGRNANRIYPVDININGAKYTLPKTVGEVNAHSNRHGLNIAVLKAEIAGDKLVMSTTVQDMSDCFPGDLEFKVTYSLDDDNMLLMEYDAVSNKDTVINITNHSYFNLNGHASGTIKDHTLQLDATHYSTLSEHNVPKDFLRVEGTFFDFNKEASLGAAIDSGESEILKIGGIDNSYTLTEGEEPFRKVSTLRHPATGRTMETYTDQPCLQIYTANGLNKTEHTKEGAVYGKHSSICLETQNTPNAIHMPWVKSPVYKAGERYKRKTGYKFSW